MQVDYKTILAQLGRYQLHPGFHAKAPDKNGYFAGVSIQTDAFTDGQPLLALTTEEFTAAHVGIPDKSPEDTTPITLDDGKILHASPKAVEALELILGVTIPLPDITGYSYTPSPTEDGIDMVTKVPLAKIMGDVIERARQHPKLQGITNLERLVTNKAIRFCDTPPADDDRSGHAIKSLLDEAADEFILKGFSAPLTFEKLARPLPSLDSEPMPAQPAPDETPVQEAAAAPEDQPAIITPDSLATEEPRDNPIEPQISDSVADTPETPPELLQDFAEVAPATEDESISTVAENNTPRPPRFDISRYSDDVIRMAEGLLEHLYKGNISPPPSTQSTGIDWSRKGNQRAILSLFDGNDPEGSHEAFIISANVLLDAAEIINNTQQAGRLIRGRTAALTLWAEQTGYQIAQIVKEQQSKPKKGFLSRRFRSGQEPAATEPKKFIPSTAPSADPTLQTETAAEKELWIHTTKKHLEERGLDNNEIEELMSQFSNQIDLTLASRQIAQALILRQTLGEKISTPETQPLPFSDAARGANDDDRPTNTELAETTQFPPSSFDSTQPS